MHVLFYNYLSNAYVCTTSFDIKYQTTAVNKEPFKLLELGFEPFVYQYTIFFI